MVVPGNITDIDLLCMFSSVSVSCFVRLVYHACRTSISSNWHNDELEKHKLIFLSNTTSSQLFHVISGDAIA